MTNDLLPCPFCQASAFYNFTDAGADRKYYRVHCSKCDARIGHPYIGKDAAREAWNTRTPSSTRANERGDLEEIRDRWKETKWPSIGYFVHGQALMDIRKLLEIIDGK